jgi:hypothetical protein
MPRTKRLTVPEVIETFERLQKGWPSELMVFCGGMNLLLLSRDAYRHQDTRAMTEDDVYAAFDIPSDGGDPGIGAGVR